MLRLGEGWRKGGRRETGSVFRAAVLEGLGRKAAPGLDPSASQCTGTRRLDAGHVPDFYLDSCNF